MMRFGIITAAMLAGMASGGAGKAVDALQGVERYDPPRKLTGAWVMLLLTGKGNGSMVRTFEVKDDCERELVVIKAAHPAAVAGCFEK